MMLKNNYRVSLYLTTHSKPPAVTVMVHPLGK